MKLLVQLALLSLAALTYTTMGCGSYEQDNLCLDEDAPQGLRSQVDQENIDPIN